MDHAESKTERMSEDGRGKKECAASRDVLDEYEDADLRCGYGNCKPEALQCCNNPKFYLLCISIFAFTQGNGTSRHNYEIKPLGQMESKCHNHQVRYCSFMNQNVFYLFNNFSKLTSLSLPFYLS